jgi:ABC-type transport system involved in multi-copper enzyme maturation permease subunit
MPSRRIPAAIAVASTTAAGRGDTTLRLWLSVLVVVVPGLLGAFWGAPLVASELESGSFRLAWTQDVSRVRWLAARLAVCGLASIAVAGLLSLGRYLVGRPPRRCAPGSVRVV